VKAVSAVNKPKIGQSSKVEVAPELASRRRPTATAQPAPARAPSSPSPRSSSLSSSARFVVKSRHVATEQPVVDRPVVTPPKPTQPPVPPPPTPTEPTMLRVALKTLPPGAEVLEDGVTLGTTPLSLEWSRATKRTLTFKIAGHRDLEKALKPESDQEFEFALEPLKKPTNPAKPPPQVKNPQKPPTDDISAFE
jgi:hypothetical protein